MYRFNFVLCCLNINRHVDEACNRSRRSSDWRRSPAGTGCDPTLLLPTCIPIQNPYTSNLNIYSLDWLSDHHARHTSNRIGNRHHPLRCGVLEIYGPPNGSQSRHHLISIVPDRRANTLSHDNSVQLQHGGFHEIRDKRYHCGARKADVRSCSCIAQLYLPVHHKQFIYDLWGARRCLRGRHCDQASCGSAFALVFPPRHAQVHGFRTRFKRVVATPHSRSYHACLWLSSYFPPG